MVSINSAIIILCISKYAVCQHYDGDSYDYSPDSSDRDSEDDDSGFVTPLDFSPLFGGGIFGLSGSASNVQNKKSIFDAGESESRVSGQNIFQDQSSGGKQFAPETFGFVPKFSQGLGPDIQPNRYQPKPLESEKPRGQLQFNIQTKHDNNYKKQPEIKPSPLSAYKEIIQNPDIYAPSVNSNPNYKIIQPKDLSRVKNDDHLAPYKKYSFQPQDATLGIPNYKALSSQYTGGSPYTQIPSVDPKLYRHKRYSGNRNQQRARTNKQEENSDSLYNYNSDYKSRPKEFDESSSYYSPDFSEYNNDNKKQYEYGDDEEYGFDEYERIKSISQQQAAEVNKNPGNCKKVQKNSMTCMVCQDPKNGGSYESCSYVSEPKNNKYAYVKEHKFDSNDEPENQEESSKTERKVPENSSPRKAAPLVKAPNTTTYRGSSKFQKKPTTQTQQPKYKGYYTQAQKPEIDSSETTKFAAYKQQNDKDYDDGFEFKSDHPDFFTDNEPKKNVEHVLAEFVKKDRSACKKVFKNEMTCYQCTDKTGLKHEECMFVSESAPKTSHLAYQEIKEFNSKPETGDAATGNTEVDNKVLYLSQANPTSPFIDQITPKKKQLYKKYTNGNQEKKVLLNPRPVELSKVLTKSITVGPVKRSVKKNPNGQNVNTHSSEYSLDNIANPIEFSSESKGAFWAETVPRYSRDLGLTLPEYMISKSHHEEIFDEFLSG